MKLKTLSTLCVAATSMMAVSTAMAWESKNGMHSTSASVALSNEYVWRGISQTDKDPAISGSFDYGHSSGFYAGTWASNVDYGDDASIEIDIYGGFASEIGESGIGYDLGVLRYMFPGEDYNFNEVYASLSYSIFTAGVAHSSDALGGGEDGTYYSLDAGYDLPMGFSLAAGLGFYDLDGDYTGVSEDSYTNYYVGVSKEYGGFGFDITYFDTDSDAEKIYDTNPGSDLTDGGFLFTISKSL